MTSNDILKLLKEKHHDDVFIPECKDGPTWLKKHRRLDAWTMKKSWKNPLTCGYEIKVTRSDFLQDKKWPEYLPLCNQFYFVTPPKLLRPSEIPEDCGLMEVASTGNKLLIKKKVSYREVALPESLMRYILMSRAVIKDEVWQDEDSRERRVEAWKSWLEERASYRTVGYLVRKKLNAYLEKLERENALLRHIKERLAKYEIDLSKDAWASNWGIYVDEKKVL
jgi:hypothetical protein